MLAPSKEAARAAMWKRGRLRFLLRDSQLEAYDFFHAKLVRILVFLFHRRFGKSFLNLTLAVENALRDTNGDILYAGPGKQDTVEIVRPLLDQVLETCPKSLRPKFNESKGFLSFYNGSRITLLGTRKEHKDSARGRPPRLVLYDECGFAEDPDYIINSVMMPAIIQTDGRIVLSSTPSLSPSHPFHDRVKEARTQGALFTLRSRDNPAVTPEQFRELVKEAGGEETTLFKREQDCEFVTEETVAVVPESTRLRIEKAPAVGELLGWGASIWFSGLTVAVQGYRAGDTVYITREHHGYKMSPVEFAVPFHGQTPPIFSHASEGMLGELRVRHGLPMVTTPRDLAAGLARLRTSISTGALVIDPDCTLTIRHLKDAVWNEGRAGMAKSGKDHGHFDAVWAVLNLLRNVPASSEYQFSIEDLSGESWGRVFGLPDDIRHIRPRDV